MTRRLVLLGLLSLAAVAAGPGWAEEASPPAVTDAGGVRLDARHQLLGGGEGSPAWRIVDAETGTSSPLRLPAFRGAESMPTVNDAILSYISYTHRGDKLQLGCVAFDWRKGKVIERKDTPLLAADGNMPTQQDPQFLGAGREVACDLVGERCKSGAAGCTPARAQVTLPLVGGKVHGAAHGVAKGHRHTAKTRPATGHRATPQKRTPATAQHGKAKRK